MSWGISLVFLATPLVIGSSPSSNGSSFIIDSQVAEQLDRGQSADFWLVMSDEAELDPARAIPDWNLRGEYVVRQLKETAHRSQRNVLELLEREGVSHRSFWIVNAVYVRGGDAGLVETLRSYRGLSRIARKRAYEIPRPALEVPLLGVSAIEWNIDRIGAPSAWSSFGARGEGIVVANIDTGVDYTHPALVTQYRGNHGDGRFDHSYNWFDPSGVCSDPAVPCDNQGHGTHTMGTMVGGDGGANQIGVAPGARWIAAKGCGTSMCSDDALLASGEWILAPTDATGENPRPDLRPHVVNNSWGGLPGDTFYQGVVDAWVAAGIFPAFAIGNAGSYCGSASSPGDYPKSYAAGAFDIGNMIAKFSSRGASMFGGELKPNIAAPGVNIRSSVPNGGYAAFSGTSMASPHVAGTVALIWSASLSLVGDVDATRMFLDSTAINVDDPTCGGDLEDNNTWGEGRLDAFAAVESSPRGPTGFLLGAVSNGSDGAPVAGARISVTGPVNRTTSSGVGGSYRLRLPIGGYDVTTRAFGFADRLISTVAITENSTTTQDIALSPLPRFAVSGRVTDEDGVPLAGAQVTVRDTPLPPVVTDINGDYHFIAVPAGRYDIEARVANPCLANQQQAVVVNADRVVNFTLPPRPDGFGYFCRLEVPAYVEATQTVPLAGSGAVLTVDLPFQFGFYDRFFGSVTLCSNGLLNFLGTACPRKNGPLLEPDAPNGAIYAFWDDLSIDAAASVFSDVIGTAPDRQFVVEFRNVTFRDDAGRRIDFEVLLHENGEILMQYRNLGPNGREQGDSATIGLKSPTGGDSFSYSALQSSLTSPEFAIRYRQPPMGRVDGTVTDANDTLAVPRVTVSARQNGAVVRAASSAVDGRYALRLGLGDYVLEATAENYVTRSKRVSVSRNGQVMTEDFALQTARVEVDANALQVVVPVGETRNVGLSITNSGSVDLEWSLGEFGGQPAPVASTRGLQRNPNYDPSSRTTAGLYTGSTRLDGSPQAVGDIVAQWPANGTKAAWGVGVSDRAIWISDASPALKQGINFEYERDGTPTGTQFLTPWARYFPADMAYDRHQSLMCQLNVGTDNGIHCWDPLTGGLINSIVGRFPWTRVSQRGLAYRADNDTFYVGGWNEGVVYHVQGSSGPNPGEVLSSCVAADRAISGLAFDPVTELLWVSTNSRTDTIYEIDPVTCDVLSTRPHPSPGHAGAGLELDIENNLVLTNQRTNTVYVIESGNPIAIDVPWLLETPSSGRIIPGEQTLVQVAFDTRGLEPGAYLAELGLVSNAGRSPSVRIPVRLVVTALRLGVNAGHDEPYVDTAGDLWVPDQAFEPGGFGYIDEGKTRQTSRMIDRTDDETIYRFQRQSPYAYRFDNLPDGVYEVELSFAEIQEDTTPGDRAFNVVINNVFALPAYDIAFEVGSFTADRRTFFTRPNPHGRVDIQFVGLKGVGVPAVNAIRLTQRPDR